VAELKSESAADPKSESVADLMSEWVADLRRNPHAKIARNVERDDENLKKLTALGWRTAVIWECETSDKARLTRRLSELFGNAR
jgi:type II secretory pathway predicted ATPase ExeA